jgi:hypothetical protein
MVIYLLGMVLTIDTLKDRYEDMRVPMVLGLFWPITLIILLVMYLNGKGD